MCSNCSYAIKVLLPCDPLCGEKNTKNKTNTYQWFRTTLYNVCSVHQGMFSTSGDVQYIGGCSVHRGDTMSISGGYHEYIGGIS